MSGQFVKCTLQIVLFLSYPSLKLKYILYKFLVIVMIRIINGTILFVMTDTIMKSIQDKIVDYYNKKDMAIFPLPRKSVLVGGCFDVFHFGHWKFLTAAKKQGNNLIIALESDRFIKRVKKRNPIHNQKQRALILASLFLVDKVVCLPDFKDEQEYFDLVLKTKPHIVAVTKGDNKLINKKRQAEIIGAKVVVVMENIKRLSSYSIININLNNNVIVNNPVNIRRPIGNGITTLT